MANDARDLHGSAPDKSPAALLLIDVINALDFHQGPKIQDDAIRMAEAIAKLKRRAKEAGVPAVYVNDNFGRWRSDFKTHVEYCLRPEVVGRPVVERLRPEEDDYFVLKPKHSGFYSTSLDLLLEHLESTRLIITGIAANICVLFTANDAYQRNYKLWVPSDCVVSNSPELTDAALAQMKEVLKADNGPSSEIDLAALLDPQTV